MRKTTLALAVLLGIAAAPAAADGAADDLAVVRKAVASPAPAEAAPAPRKAPRAAEPTWFRVRVVEKGEGGAKVKVNLPLALVRALGDDLPLPACEGLGRRHGLTLGEVLRALDSGESLVELDDEEASVRIWVE